MSSVLDKKTVKYLDIYGNETIEASNVLVVYRKMKSKRCKCHHCRINENGYCTYGRCRHERTHHSKVMRLGDYK